MSEVSNSKETLYRLTVSIPEKVGNKAYFQLVEAKTSQMDCVMSVVSSVDTGEVFIEYRADSDVTKSTLFRQFNWMQEDEARLNDETIGMMVFRKARQLWQSCDRSLLELSKGRVDLVTATSAMLVGSLLLQIRRLNFLPAGLSILLVVLGLLKEQSRSQTS